MPPEAITWTEKALRDRAHLIVWIGSDNPRAAVRTDREIETQVGLLVTNAGLGRPGRVIGTRELVIDGTPYVVAYRVVGPRVMVLRVLHGAQRWPRRL